MEHHGTQNATGGIQMVNAFNSAYAGAIQCNTTFQAPEKLSDGKCLQTTNVEQQPAGQAAPYDTLTLTPEQGQVTLNVPDAITIEIPREYTIMSETFQSWNMHLQSSLEKADSMNLSFGDRLTFLRDESQKWVADMRENDPEMFVAWLKINKYSIQQGESNLVGLPSDFTMEDYDSYVKEPFSALV